ncbi:hypothetical protein EYF80_039156 [Liparis tanakae]|uniref:Uncharacterized protein n=1 Tax=Liparis tanakae TaxID=230148 RepID=A0A4Z2GCI9_9TELE|nr:hypothetical protein EYF80_039156 [Liparis tanakae]
MHFPSWTARSAIKATNLFKVASLPRAPRCSDITYTACFHSCSALCQRSPLLTLPLYLLGHPALAWRGIPIMSAAPWVEVGGVGEALSSPGCPGQIMDSPELVA